MNAEEILKRYFGFDSFLEGQEQIISTILSGRDVLAIMPTGAGKSICYQVPALMLPGITLVISPLISLMQDQVKGLNEAGIHAAYINSSLTETQISKALKYASEGVYKIIYVAPERLESREFMEFAARVEISMVTVDEAHCISQWGQDFRPSYLKITEFVKNLAKRPIVSAFTATATGEVKDDILCMLQQIQPEVVVTGFDRKNLYFSVEGMKRKDDYILDYIKQHPTDSGIIYCATRKNVDKLFELLFKQGIPVTKYHAGLDTELRKKNQEDFIYDRTPVIVATNAFGMGIDKSNVRYVIHYNMPQSMENYYQEAGRAGRDREPAQCILLFSVQDIMIDKLLLEKKEFEGLEPEDIELAKQRDIRRLRVMEGYCKTTGCLRNYILDYFGEKTYKPCDNCGNCHREYQEVDMTAEAKRVINCVAETKGRYGLSVVTGTLMGADQARLKELGTVHYKSYGALQELRETELRTLIYQMVEEGYLYQTENQYSVLKLGDITPLKQENAKVMIRVYQEKEQDSVTGSERRKKQSARSTDALTSAGYELFELLKKLRLEIAREESVPPYIVFNDKTLIGMCLKLPENEMELLSVSGVGQNKLAKYGQRFLQVIQEYRAQKPDVQTGIESDDIDVILEEGDKQQALDDAAVRKKKRKAEAAGLVEFYLSEEEAGQFCYQDFYQISEIRNELNRIGNLDNKRKLEMAALWDILVGEDLIQVIENGTRHEKRPTTKGLEYGIQVEDKVGKSGIPYQSVKYPKIQKMIVEHLTRHIEP